MSTIRNESIYNEYANWKLEVNDLVKYLRENDSNLIIRFKHVFDVTEFLYDKLIDDPSFSDEENQIFETGFYYVFDQIDKIKNLLEDAYEGKVEDLEKRAKDVNLLLSTIDFQNELLSTNEFKQRDLNALSQMEQRILTHIMNKEDIPKEMFEKVDQLSYKIFQDMDVDYYPIDDIFFEIADELGIL